MNKLKSIWSSFADKYPSASKWIREGGLFVIISNLIAFCIVTCVVNSINCIWVAVAGMFVSGWLYNIGTTVLNGGVSMVVFFFVNKIIFLEGEPEK